MARYISKLRGEESDNYVKQTEELLKSDKKDTVYAELAKDASTFLIENDRGKLLVDHPTRKNG